jgi:hypothetical protein
MKLGLWRGPRKSAIKLHHSADFLKFFELWIHLKVKVLETRVGELYGWYFTQA